MEAILAPMYAAAGAVAGIALGLLGQHTSTADGTKTTSTGDSPQYNASDGPAPGARSRHQVRDQQLQCTAQPACT